MGAYATESAYVELKKWRSVSPWRQALLCCLVTHYGCDYENFEMFARIFTATVPVRPSIFPLSFSPTSNHIVPDTTTNIIGRTASFDNKRNATLKGADVSPGWRMPRVFVCLYSMIKQF